MKDEVMWITEASHLVLTFWCIQKFSVFRKKNLVCIFSPPPPFILFLPYIHLLPSCFLYSFTILFCLSVCCTLCFIARNYSEDFITTKWCACCFSSCLSCLQVLETVNVLAWFYAQQCWWLTHCIRDCTYFKVICFTASSDWYSKRRFADTLWKYFWVY